MKLIFVFVGDKSDIFEAERIEICHAYRMIRSVIRMRHSDATYGPYDRVPIIPYSYGRSPYMRHHSSKCQLVVALLLLFRKSQV